MPGYQDSKSFSRKKAIRLLKSALVREFRDFQDRVSCISILLCILSSFLLHLKSSSKLPLRLPLSPFYLSIS